jgi:hypothetical protein
MSEVITPSAQRMRKEPEFPHRLTVCFAPDQVETLGQAKKIYRATESFMLRLAWDNFCRANQIFPKINNGAPRNGQHANFPGGQANG